MKKVIISVLVILFIIVTGLAIWFFNQNSSPGQKINITENTPSETVSFAPINPTISIELIDCNKSGSDNNLKKDCLLLVAITKKDIAICEISLPDPQNIQFKNLCLEYVSILNQRKDYCNEFKYSSIPALKEQCLAKMDRDLSKCDDLSCYTGFWEVFNDPNICKNIKTTTEGDEQYKQTCYKEIATKMLNADLCNKINNDILKVNCKDFVWYKLALLKLDTSLCDNILSPSAMESCKNTISNAF